MSAFEDKAFLLLVAAVSVAFLMIVWPFYGAILWGVAIAIMFAPVYRRLRAGWVTATTSRPSRRCCSSS